MSLQELSKTIIEAGAPVLGTAIGGPIGLVVGALLSEVAKAFGVDAANPQDIITKIKADPEDAKNKLRIIQDNNLVELQKANYADTQNARELQNDKIKSGIKDPMYPLLAGAITVGFFSCLIALYFMNHENPYRDVICTMLGVLCSNFKDVYNYYFGSSASSARKDEFIRSKS